MRQDEDFDAQHETEVDAERAHEMRAALATQALVYGGALAFLVLCAWAARRRGVGVWRFAWTSMVVGAAGSLGGGGAMFAVVENAGRIHDSDIVEALVAGVVFGPGVAVGVLAALERFAGRRIGRRAGLLALGGTVVGVVCALGLGWGFVMTVNEAHLPEVMMLCPFVLGPAMVGASAAAGCAIGGHKPAPIV